MRPLSVLPMPRSSGDAGISFFDQFGRPTVFEWNHVGIVFLSFLVFCGNMKTVLPLQRELNPEG